MNQKTSQNKNKKEPEIKTMADVKLLPIEEQAKWEVAQELGLFEKVVETGWKSLTGRESGRIGGIISSRKKMHQNVEKKSTKKT